MESKATLIAEIEDLSDDKLREVIHFVQFLKSKEYEEKISQSIVSEPSLAEDWNKPEEDEAWSDL